MALRENELCECFANARGAAGDFGLLEIGDDGARRLGELTEPNRGGRELVTLGLTGFHVGA